MPTFLYYKDGEKQGDLLGANPAGLQVRYTPLTLFLRDRLTSPLRFTGTRETSQSLPRITNSLSPYLTLVFNQLKCKISSKLYTVHTMTSCCC